MKQKLMLLAGATALVLSLAACGDDEETDNTNTNNNNNNSQALDFSSQTAILSFLDGKTMVMEGANVPAGLKIPITGCIDRTEIDIVSETLTVTSDVGAVVGDACDFTSVSTADSFVSTAVSFTNVASDGSCFDVEITYPGLAQEGRGAINADGTEFLFEVFAVNTFGGIRCSDGNPGDDTVTFGGNATPTDVLQTYVIQ
ncbi:MAG: hypothetical protein AAFQ82_17410 [Myxococcota bacterium]